MFYWYNTADELIKNISKVKRSQTTRRGFEHALLAAIARELITLNKTMKSIDSKLIPTAKA